jgi:hypothetical protein
VPPKLIVPEWLILTFTFTKPSLVTHARASEGIRAEIDAINLANVFIAEFNHTALSAVKRAGIADGIQTAFASTSTKLTFDVAA